MTTYPTFHRLATRCLKRESDTTAIEVQIPGPGKTLPTVHHAVTFPSKERLDEEVKAMEVVTADVYESYLGTMFQIMDQNRTRFNSIRQRRYNQQHSL